jgi:general secretion pathway protein H
MPRISATGTSGFTLIEVLVVVAIAGIVVALASVNLFPSDAQVARREAADVALAIERARDQAWFGGRPTAVNFADGHLRQWRYGGRAWEADSGRDHALQPDLRVTGLFVDGNELKPGDRIVFMPDGLGIPFSVALDVRGLPWAVEGDAAGAVKAVAR